LSFVIETPFGNGCCFEKPVITTTDPYERFSALSVFATIRKTETLVPPPTFEFRQNIYISFLFQEIDIEDKTKCPFDYVEVFSGTGPQAPSLGRFCGKQPPRMVKSRGHKMAIKFHSDKMVNSKGFRARYTAGQ